MHLRMCVILRVMRPLTCACLRMRALLRLPHLHLCAYACATCATPTPACVRYAQALPGCVCAGAYDDSISPLAYVCAQARMRKICIFRAVPKNALDAIFACFFAPSANVFLCPAAYHARIMRTR